MNQSKTLLSGVLVAMAIAAPCLAQSAPEGTQLHMHQASCDHLGVAQKRMQSRLAAIHKRYAADTVFLAKLDSAQRAWQRFADAELDAIYPDPYHREGSVFSACFCEEKAALVLERVNQLEVWLGPEEDGNVCRGSRPS